MNKTNPKEPVLNSAEATQRVAKEVFATWPFCVAVSFSCQYAGRFGQSSHLIGTAQAWFEHQGTILSSQDIHQNPKTRHMLLPGVAAALWDLSMEAGDWVKSGEFLASVGNTRTRHTVFLLPELMAVIPNTNGGKAKIVTTRTLKNATGQARERAQRETLKRILNTHPTMQEHGQKIHA